MTADAEFAIVALQIEDTKLLRLELLQPGFSRRILRQLEAEPLTALTASILHAGIADIAMTDADPVGKQARDVGSTQVGLAQVDE